MLDLFLAVGNAAKADQRHAEGLAGAQHGKAFHIDHVGIDAGIGRTGDHIGAGRQTRGRHIGNADRQGDGGGQVEEGGDALFEAEAEASMSR